MWVRKTNKEISDEDKKFKPSLIMPIGFFFGLLGAIILPKITGMARFLIHTKPLSFKELLSQLPMILLISAGLSGLIYLFQLFFKTNIIEKDNTSVICDKCNKLKTDNGNYLCSCGGTFVNLKKMKWVEDTQQHFNNL